MRRALPLLTLLTLTVPAAAAPDGAKIYRDQCVRCHGENGQGVKKKYDKPLTGNLSVAQLAEVVRKTMPDDNPESLSKEDATAVASHMYEAFYSPIARERFKPAKIELTRLTVNQYRNSVADLIGGFRWNSNQWKDGGKGLKGEYFGTRGYGKLQLERIDPQVAFQFGVDPPFPRPAPPPPPTPANPDRKVGGDEKKLTPEEEKKAKAEAAKKEKAEAERKAREEAERHEYSIRWSGSVLAPDTGEYQFIMKSDQAVKLWVNQVDKPVVNALVKSGNQIEYVAPVHLTGGRVYHLRLEFSKALQGVKDKMPKPTSAFVRLEWKRPHGILEPIPARYLSPNSVPEQHTVTVPFPADDKSLGWERGTSVSKEWDAATTEAALEAANYVSRNVDTMLGAVPAERNFAAESGDPASINLDKKSKRTTVPDREKKIRAFAVAFVERAFRRPITAEQKELYVDRQFAVANGDVEAALKRVVLLTLKSPRFLFRDGNTTTNDAEIAARLAFALWDSVPDEELRVKAQQGYLHTLEEVRQQAERMMSDPRAKAKLHGFLMHWLRLDVERDLHKNPKQYPGFDDAVIADLRTSLDLFLDETVWSGSSDFRTLFTTDEVYLNGRLAKLYGIDLPADAEFRKVKLDAGKRAGVLTHPYLMTAFAYSDHSSPIHRGVFVAKGLLGTGLKPPQEAFSPLSADLHPTLTTRERVALQTKGANCQTCHAVVNPLGFPLEAFDAIGKYREKDNNKPVDLTGEYLTRTGEKKTFNGAVELAKFLADSPEAHTAFTEQLFHHLIQQPVNAYGSKRVEELRDTFAKNGYNIKKLAAEIAVSAAMKGKK
jgi:mono/diheme cytochrome c family protein